MSSTTAVDTSASRLGKEWLNANIARAYPLDDSTGGVAGTIPPAAFSDLFILTSGISPEELANNPAYISSIKNTGRSIILSINVGGVEFGDAVTIHMASDYISTDFCSYVDGKSISGVLSIGLVDVVSNLKNTTYTAEQTRIAPYIIRRIDTLCVTGIRIGDELLTGEVELVAGPGITLSVDSGNVITITASEYTEPNENTVIVDDRSLLSAVVEEYGRPVTSICGVRPDASGNIYVNAADRIPMSDNEDVLPDVESADMTSNYVVMQAMGEGSGVIRLRLYDDPQISADDIKNIANNLTELDKRSAHLDNAVSTLDNALGSVATQLTRLD